MAIISNDKIFWSAFLFLEGVKGSNREVARYLPATATSTRDIGERKNHWSKGSRVAFISFQIDPPEPSGFPSLSEVVCSLRSNEGIVAVICARPDESRPVLLAYGHDEIPDQTLSLDDLKFMSEHGIAITCELNPREPE